MDMDFQMQCNAILVGHVYKRRILVRSPMVIFSYVQCNNILVGLVYIGKIFVGLLVNVLPGALLGELVLVCPVIK
jgi:hypothetical protein